MKVFVAQSCPTLCDPIDCSPPGSSVNGILQARILGLPAIPFSRGASPPRGQSWVSCIVGGFFTIWATSEARASNNMNNDNTSYYEPRYQALWSWLYRTLCGLSHEVFPCYSFIHILQVGENELTLTESKLLLVCPCVGSDGAYTWFQIPCPKPYREILFQMQDFKGRKGQGRPQSQWQISPKHFPGEQSLCPVHCCDPSTCWSPRCMVATLTSRVFALAISFPLLWTWPTPAPPAGLSLTALPQGSLPRLGLFPPCHVFAFSRL